ncbi:single-stranded DNA-binding protein [Paenibacillus thiaminolyticus]|uniref:single-stranded DNA-binding protein n=1 Tax=Paenibacillus thiaminolyticus TaxID=49283 RepID=UPI002543A50F|nr:single-stranded DNA-binding protein [Paenibacillus thiaminolyticus]WII39512.1 single-stranded DNA-binding protein [Paenibacillus thiaminolyticus]
MGEEKPDEELMGKRKSSPRLSTTFNDVDTLRIASREKYIHPPDNFFSLARSRRRSVDFIFQNWEMYVTINVEYAAMIAA